MRVWDIPANELCDKHLVAQHFEIHCIYSVITKNKEGWRNHPEVKRWRGHLNSLILRHNETAEEMYNRGMNHNSPLDWQQDSYTIPEPWQPVQLQRTILRRKHDPLR